MKRIGFMVAALAMAAACGGSSSAGSAALSPAATSTPSAAVQTATIAQYASIVASSERSIRSGAKYVEQCPTFGAESIPPTCAGWAVDVNATATTLYTKLTGAEGPDKPTNQLFIGAPPTEIATLVADTKAAAKAASKIQNYRSAGAVGRYVRFQYAVRQLLEQLDAWKPYGG